MISLFEYLFDLIFPSNFDALIPVCLYTITLGDFLTSPAFFRSIGNMTFMIYSHCDFLSGLLPLNIQLFKKRLI